MSEYILPIIALTSIFMMYYFILLPINQSCNFTFNYVLGKEIARRLYHELYPDFTYQAYHDEDKQHQVILQSALEEFRNLLANEKKNKD